MGGVTWFLLQRCVGLLACFVLGDTFAGCTSLADVGRMFHDMNDVSKTGVITLVLLTGFIVVETFVVAGQGILNSIKKRQFKKAKTIKDKGYGVIVR